MAFENLAQHLGGYSQGMLQAAIAGREQAMNEQNMRLQQPLQMAQLWTDAMGQMHEIEQQEKRLALDAENAKSANILSAARADQIRQETLTHVLGREDYLSLQKYAADQGDAEAQAAWFNLQRAGEMKPHELQAAKENALLIVANRRQAEVEADIAESTQKAAEELIRIGRDTAAEELKLAMEEAKNAPEKLRGLKAKNVLLEAQGEAAKTQSDLYKIQLEDIHEFNEKGFEGNFKDPQFAQNVVDYHHSKEGLNNLKNAQEAIKKLGPNPSVVDIQGVLARNLDPRWMGFMTAVAGKRDSSAKTPLQYWDETVFHREKVLFQEIEMARKLVEMRTAEGNKESDAGLHDLYVGMYKYKNVASMKPFVLDAVRAGQLDIEGARAIFSRVENHPDILGWNRSHGGLASHPSRMSFPGAVITQFVPEDVWADVSAGIVGAVQTIPGATASVPPTGQVDLLGFSFSSPPPQSPISMYRGDWQSMPTRAVPPPGEEYDSIPPGSDTGLWTPQRFDR